MISREEVKTILKTLDNEAFSALLDEKPDYLSMEFEDVFSATSMFLLSLNIKEIEKARIMLDKGIDLNPQPKSPVTEYLSDTDVEDIDSDFLRQLIDSGAVRPNDARSCRKFWQFALREIFASDALDVLKVINDSGHDLVKIERAAQRNLITRAIILLKSKEVSSGKIIQYLLDSGCSKVPLADDKPGNQGDLLWQALNRKQFHIGKMLLDSGVETTASKSDILSLIACSRGDMPQDIVDRLICAQDDFNINVVNPFTEIEIPLLMLTVFNFNFSFLKQMLDLGADINVQDAEGETALICAVRGKQADVVDQLISLGADINKVNGNRETALDIAASTTGAEQIFQQLKKEGGLSGSELAGEGEIDIAVHQSLKAAIIRGESWADAALEKITSMEPEQASLWNDLVQLCLENSSSKPTKRWSKQADDLIASIGVDSFRECMLEWLPRVADKRTSMDIYYRRMESDGLYFEGDERLFIMPENTLIIRGLIWCCYRFGDEDSSRILRRLAEAMYRKVPGVGMRNARIANAALYSLSLMQGEYGLKELIVLRSATRYNPALTNINRVFDKLAEGKGMTPEELASQSTPDYGLTGRGYYREKLGEYDAEIRLVGTGKTEFVWIKGDKTQKTVPATIKQANADDLKRIKTMVKELQTASRAHCARLEQSYLQDRMLDMDTWKAQYVDHKLIGYFAQRLIWQVKTDKKTILVMPTEKGCIDSKGQAIKLPKTAEVALWHPTMSSTVEVVAWREWLLANEITQPFKQAHREVYLLTDAEKDTSDHSLRFANHILLQHQFHALASQRGWQQQRGGAWDGGRENSAWKSLRTHSMNVELQAEGSEAYGYANQGLFTCVATSKVVFYKSKPLKLESIPAQVFSEVMRDVDLFVGVCSIGTDPEWRDREDAYWQNSSFGQLSAAAKIRREVLEALIPRLEISNQLRIEDRFLIVEGKLRTYKIHLGSSNILMEPGNSYLCIVGTANRKKIWLPFEDDQTLSLILSKAVMLARDDKIKDASILNQINRFARGA